MSVIPFVLSFTFLMLSLLHFMWAIRSTWGYDAVIPTQENGERLFTPTPISCTIVGLGLLTIAIYYFQATGLIVIPVPTLLDDIIGWTIPSIFTLRAIGDFKYAGFFKKIRYTKFGKMDTLYFSPFCVILATLGFIFHLYGQ